MKKTIHIALAAAVAAAATACGDSSIQPYDEGYNAVRFAGVTPDPDAGNNSGGVAYYNFSFVDAPGEDTYDFNIPLYLIGKGLDKDTPVNVEVNGDGTTAPDGSYEITQAFIPAYSREGAITVRLIKTPELEGSTSYTLALRLLPSEGLMTGDNRYLNSRITWNNDLPLPSHNNNKRSYHMLIAGDSNFISTSTAKMSTNGLMAIVAALGWNFWDNPDAPQVADDLLLRTRGINKAAQNYYKYLPQYSAIYATGSYQIYSRIVGEWLEKYELEHGGPLLHNSGELAGQPVKARYN